MKTCADRDPKTTIQRNPSTGEHLLLCAEHAKLHREGHAFTVYTLEDE